MGDLYRATGDLKRGLKFFGTVSFLHIIRYHLQDHMSNDLVLSESRLRQVTFVVRERQLRLYGPVLRLTAEDPANPILSVEIRAAGP